MRTFAVAVAVVAGQASAFWGTAHILLARRAEQILADNAQSVLDAALAEMVPLQKYYPSLVEEGDHPFSECATFADNIKGKGYSWQSNWHFINLPYLDEEGTTVDDFDFTMPDVDVVQALTDLTKFLKGEIGEADSDYVARIAESFSYEEDQRSFALRLIIHYVGDIHQPLHAVAEVDSTYPTGDRGGNSEKIPSQDGVNCLHAVWDSVIYKYTGRPKTPLSADAWDWYTSEALSLASEHPVNTADILPSQFSDWANESLDLSQTVVYPGFETGEVPSEEYQEAALPILEYRMMIGGARLADVMMDIYGGSGSNAFLQ